MFNIPFFSKKKVNRSYLGLLLKEERGIVMLMKDNSGAVSFVDDEKFEFTNGWNSLVEDIDQALFRLETKNKVELTDVIYFLYSHLIEESSNQIKKPYQAVLHKIDKELDLKPLGFIDAHEAVVRSIEEKEEIKFSGIIVELDKNDLTVFIYKGGSIVQKKAVERSKNLVEDLQSIFELMRGRELLPTRMVLYNSQDLDAAVSQIVSHRWPTELFVQLPKVEIIKETDLLRSLVDIFSQQITDVKKPAGTEVSVVTKTGFLIGGDVGQPPAKKPMSPITNQAFLLKFIDIFKKLPVNLPKFNFTKGSMLRKLLLPLGLLIILTGVLLNEYFLHQATLEIFVPSDKIEKKMSLSVGASGKVDLILAPIKKTVDLSVETTTTGKKDIGEAATGEVTLFNFNKETSFSKGTKIETKGLSFTLNEEIKVASASLTSDSSAKLPGRAKAKVTAAKIGPESNLAKGQTFKIDNLDTDAYFAKNEIDFSGGSEKQITVVSKADYTTLEERIAATAKDQKKAALKLAADTRVISQLTTTDLADTNYSKELGEQASAVSLKAKVETTFFTYKKDDLTSLIEKQIGDKVKTGFGLNKDNIKIEVDKVNKDDDQQSLDLSVTAQAVKEIDKEKVISRLLGKPEGEIEKILKPEFAITGYNVRLRQPLPIPFLSNRLPYFRKNINLKVDVLD